MIEAIVKDLNDRCLLMCRAEADMLTEYPDFGEEIYHFWRKFDPNIYDLDISSVAGECAERYNIEVFGAEYCIEAIREIVLQYDLLITTATNPY
jgi:hypothetical protein